MVRKRDRMEPGSREKLQQTSSKCVIVVARCLLLPTICGHYSGCTIYIKGMFNKPPAPENKVQTVKYGRIYTYGYEYRQLQLMFLRLKFKYMNNVSCAT